MTRVKSLTDRSGLRRRSRGVGVSRPPDFGKGVIGWVVGGSWLVSKNYYSLFCTESRKWSFQEKEQTVPRMLLLNSHENIFSGKSEIFLKIGTIFRRN